MSALENVIFPRWELNALPMSCGPRPLSLRRDADLLLLARRIDHAVPTAAAREALRGEQQDEVARGDRRDVVEDWGVLSACCRTTPTISGQGANVIQAS